jgi:CopG family transcriptional regulator, nickel-responsive regulator
LARKVVRTTVSLEPELLAQLDGWVARRVNRSRSDAVRDLIRRHATTERLADPDADSLGAVALLYRHTTPNVLRRLTAVEHRWGDHVRSTQHVHLEGDACVEVVVLFGRHAEVAAASEELRGVKGILGGGYLTASPSVAGGTTGHRHPHPRGGGRRAARKG